MSIKTITHIWTVAWVEECAFNFTVVEYGYGQLTRLFLRCANALNVRVPYLMRIKTSNEN